MFPHVIFCFHDDISMMRGIHRMPSLLSGHFPASVVPVSRLSTFPRGSSGRPHLKKVRVNVEENETI